MIYSTDFALHVIRSMRQGGRVYSACVPGLWLTYQMYSPIRDKRLESSLAGRVIAISHRDAAVLNAQMVHLAYTVL